MKFVFHTCVILKEFFLTYNIYYLETCLKYYIYIFLFFMFYLDTFNSRIL